MGLLTAIPFIMAFGPLIGYFVGRWLDKQFDTKPYLAILFIVLGFVAAGREIWGLIKRASRDSDEK